jgi:Cd2+/Zn2+-exporting ATPase/Cu+-exporting ATPase
MVLEKAAIAERLSEHSIAKAILRRAAEKNVRVIEPERFEYQPGKGITCWVGEEKITVGNLSLLQEQHIPMQEVAAASNDYSDVYVASNNRLLGIIRISDIIRQEAFEAVRRVNAMGLKTVLLTGDSAKVADKVAKQLGVMSVEAELMPEEKASRIRAMINAGGKVAMVGDGINDAPALTEASVGVAMGTGTDVARESADVVLLGNDLFKFVETITIAKRCRRIILANFAGTVMVDTAGILLAAAGFLSPPLAAFIHVSSELLFILNSARLLPKLAPKKTIKDSNEAISGSTWRVCNE